MKMGAGRSWLGCLGVGAFLFAAGEAAAHTLTITQMLVSFNQPGIANVQVDVDLTVLLESPDAYLAFATAPADRQQPQAAQIALQVADSLQLFVGSQRVPLILQSFTPADASKSDFLDASISKLSTFRYLAIMPASREPLQLRVPLGAPVDFPIAYTIQIPSAHVSVTRWLESGVHESDPYAWSDRAPRSIALAAAPQAAAPGGATPASAAGEGVDSMPWYRQLPLYLSLGFHHIVPEGTDHILFVLGLFFLGITWRKLLAQTSVFTVAHATTLFLSTYGIFRLPSRYVEPAIALSIAFIAIENVFSPKLGPGRLAVVFGFGLIHGLGFASSLRDVPFPKHQFIVALLGFNFGVDAGQLFVIGVAFLAVGWFRFRPWFRARVAVPCSCAIAAIGLIWAIQRIVFYSRHPA